MLPQPFVLVAKRPQPLPEQMLERFLVVRRAAFEDYDERLEQARLIPITPGNIEQRRKDPKVVPWAA